MSYTIDTNLESARVPQDFLSTTSDFLGVLFDKPKKAITGQLRTGQVFDFAGSADPCAVMHLIRGSQNLNSVANKAVVERYVAAISEHIQNKLNIHKSRLMIFYHEHDVALIGNDGKTLNRIWSEIETKSPSDRNKLDVRDDTKTKD